MLSSPSCPPPPSLSSISTTGTNAVPDAESRSDRKLRSVTVAICAFFALYAIKSASVAPDFFIKSVMSPTRSFAFSVAAVRYTSAVTSVAVNSVPSTLGSSDEPTTTTEHCPSSARLPSAVLSSSTASVNVLPSTVTLSLVVAPSVSVGITYCAVTSTPPSLPSTPSISTTTRLLTSRLRDAVAGRNATAKANTNSSTLYIISFFLSLSFFIVSHRPRRPHFRTRPRPPRRRRRDSVFSA